MKQITSVQNPYIKSLVQLQEKAKIRKETGTFLVEGQREIELALKGGYEVDVILICPDVAEYSENLSIKKSEHQIIEISKDVYQKLAYRDTTEALSDLKLSKNPLILVGESLEKPGNVGAILRTADAANIDAVIIANPKSDIYNPNIVRSSVGCLFTRQIAVGTTDEVITYLKANHITIYSATLQDATEYHTQNYTTPTALVVGTEATGLSEKWRTESYKNIIIPMHGVIDSMNVSVAAAVLLFEAKRQRGF
jgi:TrmH family RNA methyltransferase